MRERGVLGGLLLGLMVAACLFLALGNAAAASQESPVDQAHAVASAAEWMVVAHQNEDGGYAAFSTGAGNAPSDVAGTVDALLALAAVGYGSSSFPESSGGPLAYLQQHDADVDAYLAQGGGATGKMILALAAAGQDPRRFAGQNLVLRLSDHLSPTGQFNTNAPFDQALAVMAQVVVSASAPLSATTWLAERQADTGDLAGSWDDGYGTDGNIDATAMAIMALVAAGEPITGTVLGTARSFLASAQLPSGGWGYAPGLPESANSTAMAVQALAALGEPFYQAEGHWAPDGVAPLAALLAWRGESGAFQADHGEGPFDDFFTTVQALPAAAGRAYPLPARYEAARRALGCLESLQDEASGGWEEFAGTSPNAGGTSRAIQAIVAAGADPAAPRWRTNGTDPLTALAASTPSYLAGGRGGRVGLVMQGVVAAGGDVTDLGGLNLPLSMTTFLSPTGEYASTAFGPFSHAEAMLGLIAADEAVDPAAIAWLLAAQGDDGSWGSPDADGIALHVLGRLGESAPVEAVSGAIAALQATIQPDGGWGYGLPSSPNSTSEVAQGLVAAGENPFAPRWSQVVSGSLHSGADPVIAQQGADGCWPNLFGPGADPFATTDAILLLALQPPWGTRVAGAGVGSSAVGEATPTSVATTVASATPTGAATSTRPATPLPSPTETATAMVVAAEPPSPEASATSPASALAAEETAGTSPLLAWILIGVAAVLVTATFFWIYRSRT